MAEYIMKPFALNSIFHDGLNSSPLLKRLELNDLSPMCKQYDCINKTSAFSKNNLTSSKRHLNTCQDCKHDDHHSYIKDALSYLSSGYSVYPVDEQQCQAVNTLCILDKTDLCYTNDEGYEKLQGYTSFLDVSDGDLIVKSPESKSHFNEMSSRRCTPSEAAIDALLSLGRHGLLERYCESSMSRCIGSRQRKNIVAKRLKSSHKGHLKRLQRKGFNHNNKKLKNVNSCVYMK